MRRVRENRRRSARKFNAGARKVHKRNVGVMRGGYRL